MLDKIINNFRNILAEFIDTQRKYLTKFVDNFGDLENFVKIWANFKQKSLMQLVSQKKDISESTSKSPFNLYFV